MGLFSDKQTKLSSDLFSPVEQIKPSAQEAILGALFKIVPPQLVHAAWVVGSMLGHRYDDDSDIDLQIQINDKTKVSFYSNEVKVFNRSDTNKLIGKHPVNFFILPIIKSINYNNLTGAYDLINQKWVKRSMSQPAGFDQRLTIERPYLGMLKREMARQLEDVKENPTLKEAKDVADLYEKLDVARKTTYNYGIGTPRYTPANVEYKAIAHEYGEVPEKIHRLVKKIMAKNV